MASRICWYCAYAFREDPSNVSCRKDYKFHARTYCCSCFLECTRKKYASDSELKI